MDEKIVIKKSKHGKGVFAARDIKKGDEITWDYSTTLDEDEWEMNCSCGSIICRKKVRDFKYLPREIQLRYKKLGIIPKWILKRYDKKD
jgi:hypothetical protein